MDTEMIRFLAICLCVAGILMSLAGIVFVIKTFMAPFEILGMLAANQEESNED
jgi:hypothetical protein